MGRRRLGRRRAKCWHEGGGGGGGGGKLDDDEEEAFLLEEAVLLDDEEEEAVLQASCVAPLVNNFNGPCTVPGVRIEEPVAAAAAAEAVPAEALAEPAPPPPPAMTGSPQRDVDVVFRRHPEEGINGRDVRVEEPAAAAAATETGSAEELAEPAPPPPPAMIGSPRRDVDIVIRRHPEEGINGREEPAAAAAVPAEAAPAESLAEQALPPAPAMADYSRRRVIDIEFHDDADNRHPEEEIEGHDGGLWDYALQHWHRLPLLEESPWPPASDDASATGRTYDDITKSPPPHLRCVVSPLSSLPPVLRGIAAAPLPRVLSPSQG